VAASCNGHGSPCARSRHGVLDGPGTVATVGTMFAAPVWHYWIGVLVFIPVMLITIGFIVAFLRKTESPRYGRDD
jgi:membrane protein implicated in regulation of membrane protease activity